MISTNNEPDGVVIGVPVEAKLVQKTKVVQETRLVGETTHTETIPDPHPWRSYVRGGPASSGYKIVYLIHKSDDFAIYLDEETAVIDGTTAVEAKLSAIASEVASVESHLPKEKGECDKINRQVAKAMWLCAVDSDEGRSVIEHVTDRFIADVRLIYLLSAMGACALVWAAGGLYFSISQAALFQLFWFQAIALGITGALFSVVANQTEIPVDLNNSTFMHCATGASRTFVGLIAGAVPSLVLKEVDKNGGARECRRSFFVFFRVSVRRSFQISCGNTKPIQSNVLFPKNSVANLAGQKLGEYPMLLLTQAPSV